jgi:hypothetical protein
MAITLSGMQLLAGLTSATTGFFGSLSRGVAVSAAARLEAESYKAAQAVSYQRAMDAFRVGEHATREVERRKKRLRGAQRAGYAGQGVDVSVGTARDIQQETEVIAEADKMMIRNNARSLAMGYRLEAESFGARARLAKSAAKERVFSTIATAGIGLLGGIRKSFHEYSKDPYFFTSSKAEGLARHMGSRAFRFAGSVRGMFGG